MRDGRGVWLLVCLLHLMWRDCRGPMGRENFGLCGVFEREGLW